MRIRILAVMVALVILLSTASAFAVQTPYISVTKEVSPDFFNEGDNATITINISGEGEPAVIQNPVDVMIVIDRSGSMDDDGGNPKQPIHDTKEAAKTFVDQLNSSNDRSGLVTFNDHATLDEPLTFVQQDVKDEIDDISVGGYTAIGDGILTALTELADNGREDAYLFEVVLSDGMNNRGTDPVTAAEGAAANGIIIFTIGLGSGADGETLQDIADETGGDYYYAPDSSDLEAIYQEIAEEIKDIAGSNVILTDILPDGVQLIGDLPQGCSSEENPDGTTIITCTVPGNVNIGDSFVYSFDIIVNDPDLTEVNLEGSGVLYDDYNGDAAEIIFDNPPVIVCGLDDIPLDCSAEGTREWFHDWNHEECGDDYYTYEEDQNCLCIYSEWLDAGCIADGLMSQVRDELSGLPFCTDPLYQEVPNVQCDCQTTDTPLECSADGFREWLHEWNYPYCGDDYYTDEQDASCDCIASEYDRLCIDDELAEVYYTWNFGYCGEDYSQPEGDPQCASSYVCDEWYDIECVSDGMMEQERYCEDQYGNFYYEQQEVQNPTCDCLATEYDRVCDSDGYAEVFYSWNYDYCGSDYSEIEEDQNCLCFYSEWIDAGCIADGLMSQVRDELSGLPYCVDPLYQEVPNVQCDCETTDTPLDCSSDGFREWLHEWNYLYCGDDYYTDEQDASCDCIPSEYFRECTGDSVAEVYYSWNYPYCGDDYSQPEADPQCASSYECDEWYDLGCVSDGMMEQERYCEDQYGSFYYEQQEVQDSVCDCLATEYYRECTGDGTAEVYYEWNYDYCGESYSQPEVDQTCLCIYTEWLDAGCVADGLMSQTRTEESGLPFCEEPLSQEVFNGECDCVSTEYDRSCVDDGTAEVFYSWNYPYCGEDYSQLEDDGSCDCVYSDWVDDACVDDGLMRQTRYEVHEYSYCTGPFEQSVENSQCDCIASEYFRECIDDFLAEVYYEWNYDYCYEYYEDYSQPEEDETCASVYECDEWYDLECVADGIMEQERYCEDQYGNFYYEQQEVQDSVCDCIASEYDRECVDDGTAEVYYEWNFGYCGEPYSQQEEDGECSCIYTEWVNDGCVADGMMSQIREELSGYEYCEEPLSQEVENEECSCVAEEVGRVCSGEGTANVSYEWNYDYCGEDYAQEEDDELCACAEGDTRNCGSDVGRCEFGSQTCVEGQWSECVGGIGPTGEFCNGIDDNCNGQIDEAGVCGGGGGGGSSEIEEDFCGNLFCGENETCSSCPRDCGVCDDDLIQGSEPGEGEICNPLWECDEWSDCVDGKQTRTCRDRWECDENNLEYEEERDCDGETDGITGLVTGQESPFQWWIALLAALLSGLVYWQRGRITSGTGRILGAK